MCSLSLYLNDSPPPNDSSPLSPALKVVAALSAIICYCKHSQWISLCLTMSTGFNYWWMSRMSAGSTSFLSEPNPFLVLCNIIPHCQSALINILHIQHLWSVFHCSSSGEMSVAALQMDIGASPETIQFPHTTSLTCVLKNARPWPLTPGKKITWAQSGSSCLHPKTHHSTLVIASGGSIINNYFSPSRTVWSLWCIVFLSEGV